MRRASSHRGHIAVAAALIATAIACPVRADAPGEVRPVSGFEVDRYLGLWHEIALIPTRFQEDCTAGTTATYGPAEDIEGITVLNSCIEADGSRSTADGRARFTGSPEEGALEVAFVSLLGVWLWPLAGDYIVFALDPDYRWAAIGHPSRDYGWILARDERLAPEVLKRIRSEFREAGYDTCALRLSPRELGDPRTPLCELP